MRVAPAAEWEKQLTLVAYYWTLDAMPPLCSVCGSKVWEGYRYGRGPCACKTCYAENPNCIKPPA